MEKLNESKWNDPAYVHEFLCVKKNPKERIMAE